MRFNYWLEKKKFEEEWAQKRIEYAAAGMPEDDIQQMYEFDLTLFRKERIYQTQSVPLEPSYLQKGRGAPEKSRWLMRYVQALTQSDQNGQDDISAIPDQTDNPKIYRLFQEMDSTNFRLIALLLDGYTQAEIAVRLGISQPAVSKRMTKIKKLLE